MHPLQILETGCNLEIHAASGDGNSVPSVDMIAYTGKDMQLNGQYWPVVVDLSQTKAAASVPILFNHNPEVVVGHTEVVEILSTKIKAKGKLSGVNDRTNEIRASAGNGMPWQVSVGMASKRMEFVDSQSSVKVNGKTFAGPLYVARDNMLREISIVPIGADADTSAKLSASFYQGGTCMFEEFVTKMGHDPAKLTPELKATLQAQFDEIQRLRVVASNPPTNLPPVPPVNPNPTTPANNPTPPIIDITAFLPKIKEEVDNLLKAKEKQNERQNVPVVMLSANGSMNFDSKDQAYAVLQAGLLLTAKIADVHKFANEQVLDRASKMFRAGLSLQEFTHRAACLNGFSGPANFRDHENLRAMLKAAFSTIEIPTILSNTANISLLQGYMGVDQSWRQFTKIGSVTDFKEITRLRAYGGFTFREVAPHGRIQHATMSEEEYGNRAKTYGRMIQIGREDFVNDSLDAFSDIPRLLGRGGATGLARAVYGEFMDNSTFFTVGNANVSTGALGISGLNSALTVFRKLKGSDGEYLMNEPAILLAPVELEATANQLFRDTNLVGGNTTVLNSNPHVGKYRPVVSPHLSDATITGNSTTAYYLLSDPNAGTPVIEVVFLNGRDTPIVETAEPDFSQLGVAMRAYFDWGVRKQDPKGGVRSSGV